MASDSPGICVLCPTRWTVRAEALKSILDNYNVLLELWTESLDRAKDAEMKARVQGVAAQMMKFDYFFGVYLGLLILRHSDNLPKTMQKAHISTAEGQVVAAMTVSALKSLCIDASFELFWHKVATSAADLPIDEPTLPRHRKLPHRFDDGSAPTFHVTVKDHYRVIYFEALDLITSCIDECFNQPGYKTYMQMSKRSSSRQQLHNHMKKNYSLCSPFMVLILMPCSYQRIWKFFQEIFRQNEKW